MTIKIIKAGDFPVGAKTLAPTIAFSKKNTIVLSKSLCAALQLDEKHGHVLFGNDKDYPTDIYIRKAAPEELDDAFTVLDRRIHASEGKGFSIHVKKSLGLDEETGWSFPVRKGRDGWFAVGVKRGRSTEKKGGRK